MKDIELPPLPDGEASSFGSYTVFDVETLQAYARAAVEADRAQRVPDGWVQVTQQLLNSQEPWLYTPCWLAFPSGAVLRGVYEWRQGRNPDRFISDEVGDVWAFDVSHVMPVSTPPHPSKAMLASTPAQPAQQSGWTEESGLVIDFANRVELACYDQGSAECMAAVQQILDGKDRGDGVANEPWESIRRRLISLVAPAPAQQEPDWKDMYEKEKRRSAMWIAKYEKDIGPLECAGPVSHQEPSPQERKPMTPEQVAETVFEVNGNEPSALFWRDLVSAVERHHGIKE